MFKYNELSDLKNGSLVTPLSKMDDGSIRCIDFNNQECFYTMKDFDFRKKPEERKMESDSLEEEIKDIIKEDPQKEEEPNKDITYQDMLDEMEKDDSIYDGTDEPEIDPIDPVEPIIDEEEGFCSNEEIDAVLELAGINKKKNTKYTIWKDIIKRGNE